MKILYFSHRLPSANSRFIWDELEHFHETDEVEYLSITVTEEAEKTRFPHVVIPFQESLILKKLRWQLWKYDWACTFRNPGFRTQLNDYLKSSKPDIIHCHFAYEGLMMLHNLEVDVPVILHFHGYDASEMLHHRSYVKSLRKAVKNENVHFIYCSRNIRSKLAEKGIENLRSHVLYYGVDMCHFKPSMEEPIGSLTFLHVSNLQEKKGLDYSLRAFRKFIDLTGDASSVFLIVGSGHRRPFLERLVGSLSLEERVKFLGQQSREEVIRLLDEAHVFVHHSITADNGDQEGIPNALIEAMAMGVPVLSCQHSGIPELVESEMSGYLSPERDTDDMARQMIKISQWSKFRIPASREHVDKWFSKDKHVEKLQSIYEDILERA